MYKYSPVKRNINNSLAFIKPFRQKLFTKPQTIIAPSSLGKLPYPNKALANSFFTVKPIRASNVANRNKKQNSYKKLGVKNQKLGQRLGFLNNTYFSSLPKINTIIPIKQRFKNSPTILKPLFKRENIISKKVNSSFRKPFNPSYNLKIQPSFKKSLISFAFIPTNSFTSIPQSSTKFNNVSSPFSVKPYGITKNAFSNSPFSGNSMNNKSSFSIPKVHAPLKFNNKALTPLNFKDNSFSNQYSNFNNNKFFNNNWRKNYQTVKVKTLPLKINTFNNSKQYIPIKQGYSNTINIPIKYTKPNQYVPFASNRNYGFINSKNKFIY
ncbi:hypothetical protein HPDP_00356 [Candidatus Hepatincola sp. Pdp]